MALMKTIHSLSLAAVIVTLLPSCSLVARWGSERPRFTLLNEERTQFAGKEFLTRRYLVAERPYETFSETLEIRDGFALSSGSVGSKPSEFPGAMNRAAYE